MYLSLVSLGNLKEVRDGHKLVVEMVKEVLGLSEKEGTPCILKDKVENLEEEIEVHFFHDDFIKNLLITLKKDQK